MARILLLAAAAIFTAFGIYLSVWPEGLEPLGIVAQTAVGRTELRAFYGGLELGLAAFLAICALRESWWLPGCLALALANIGIAGARVAGLIVDRSFDTPMIWFLGVELGLAALALFAARQTSRRAPR